MRELEKKAREDEENSSLNSMGSLSGRRIFVLLQQKGKFLDFIGLIECCCFEIDNGK